MIQTIDITEVQKAFILNQSEDHFRDFKSKDIKPSKLTKTIAAFANAVGGEVFIGIENDKTWRGFDEEESANAHIQVLEGLFPLGADFHYSFLKSPNSIGIVLQITISKTREIITASDGKPYVRRGAQSLPIDTEDKLKRLQLDKGISSFEDTTVNIPLEFITDSNSVYNFMIDIVPTSEPLPWLKKQLLIKNDLPIVAGIMLFSDTPQIAMPKQSGIKIYRYKSKELVGTRETLAFQPISVEGNAYEQIYKAVEVVTEIIENIEIITNQGKSSLIYPNETLHEIITNAVLHRDYSIASDIHIRIFDNRIEIESPGKLPGHITSRNILKEQFARNGKIVRLINKFPNPPNKDVGEGLNTAFDAMRKLRLKEPEIIDLENSVLVKIKHESLESPETIITQYLDSNPDIRNRQAREITGIASENSMKNIFYNLRDKGAIEQVPGTRGRGTKWRKRIS